MPMEEYTISLEIPRRYYEGEVRERVDMFAEEYAQEVDVAGNKVFVLVNCYPHEDTELETHLVGLRVPFDRHSENMVTYHDGSPSESRRIFRPDGCVCGRDYDRTFLTIGGMYYAPIADLKRILDYYNQQEDSPETAGGLKLDLTTVVVNNSPEYIAPLEEY